MAHQTVSYAMSELLHSCPGPVVEPDPTCPVEITLAVLRGRWTALVILELMHGPRSFSQLAQALPTLSDKVLTDRLAQLVEAGAVDRRRRADWPPRVRYALTERGRCLAPVLEALWEWGATASAPPRSGTSDRTLPR